jgi:acyl-ACP thioesterase
VRCAGDDAAVSRPSQIAAHEYEMPLLPAAGRTFSSWRRIRLSDLDVSGRLRLDAVARYLQDVATDDVAETGWGAPEHLWVVRRYRLEVMAPFLEDREVELVTWGSGVGPAAAGRRTTLAGDRGGRIEADSVWIHLAPNGRAARLEGFGVYAESAVGRVVSTKKILADPPADAARTSWRLRTTDLDVLGHANNAIHWQAVEDALLPKHLDPRLPHRAQLEYRHALDLGDDLELAEFRDGEAAGLGFLVGTTVKAVARLEPA